MDDERKFEEIREITSSDPVKEKYGLSEEGKLLSQVESTEDKKTTSAVPPSSDDDGSSQAVVGTTYFPNVRSTTLAYNKYAKSGLHLGLFSRGGGGQMAVPAYRGGRQTLYAKATL